MAAILYTAGLMFVDGILAAESVSFNLEVDSNNQVVITQGKGFGGITVGATTCKVDVVTAIPKSGYEIDYLKRLTDRKVCEFTGWRGGSQVHLTGFIMTLAEKHAVNQTSDGTISAICGAPD